MSKSMFSMCNTALKALSTLSQKSETVAENGDCRTFLRQCGQGLMRDCWDTEITRRHWSEQWQHDEVGTGRRPLPNRTEFYRLFPKGI